MKNNLAVILLVSINPATLYRSVHDKAGKVAVM